MRMLLFTLVGALAACGPRAGDGEAHWVGPGVDISLKGKATGGWCPVSRTVLVEVSDQDRPAGLSWQFDSLRPAADPVVLPAEAVSVRSATAAVARCRQLE